MTKVYKNNFIFVAERYEEWQGGQCISQGPIDTRIVAEVNGDKIYFNLDEILQLRILKSFEFETTGFCVLSDRVQYAYETSDFNPIVPMICNIFYKGDNIEYVRFAMTNPDRLIEFYGYMEQLGQPSTGLSKKSIKHTATAESILQEMASYGMLKADAVMERGINLHNEVQMSEVCTIQGGEKTIESLKLLIKALELDEEESEMNGRGTSMLKPKILEFIASCNYRLGNFNTAYCVAKQDLEAIDEAIEDSVFTGIPRSMYGAEGIENIINLIENAYYDQVEDEDDIWAVDPKEIITDTFDRFVNEQRQPQSKNVLSKQSIEQMVEIIHKVQKMFNDYGNKSGNTQMFMIANGLEMFLNPLYYAWEKMKYGWHTDFLNEGDSMFGYLMFEADIHGNIDNSIKCLENGSPFTGIEKDGIITSSLLAIFRTIKNKLNSGEF